MGQKVLLDEGGSVSVHTRIKDMCKAARNRLGYTNQDICDRIAERFGIEDFSVNTVNNFFSERSKATTIYTTGYICAVLDISLDSVFNIQRNITSDEEAEFVRQLANLKVDVRLDEQEIAHLKDTVEEKNKQLAEADAAIAHYREEISRGRGKVQAWIFATVLSLLVISVVFIIMYLLRFDIGNPAYGLFH